MRGAPDGDAEDGQGLGRVAGVVAERSGEVARSSPAEHPDGEVAHLAMTWGPAPVRT